MISGILASFGDIWNVREIKFFKQLSVGFDFLQVSSL